MKPSRHPRLQWELDIQAVSSIPSSLNASERSGNRYWLWLTVHLNGSALCPPRNSQEHWKRQGRGGMDDHMHCTTEGVIGVFDQMHKCVAHRSAHFTRCIGHCRQSVVLRQHEQTSGELRQSLAEVRGTTTKIRLQSKQVRLRAICRPWFHV